MIPIKLNNAEKYATQQIETTKHNKYKKLTMIQLPLTISAQCSGFIE